MNEQNLIPITSLSSEEAKKRGRNGGLVKSVNKKVASRIRELKRKGLTSESAKHLLDIYEDAGYSASDSIHLLQGHMVDLDRQFENTLEGSFKRFIGSLKDMSVRNFPEFSKALQNLLNMMSGKMNKGAIDPNSFFGKLQTEIDEIDKKITLIKEEIGED